MPFWIEGWVEVTVLDEQERDDEYAWLSAIKISTIIDVADTVSEKLFGLSKRCVAGEYKIDPLAANRGFPKNPSTELRNEIQNIQMYENEHGKGELGGFTYATWREIKSVAFENKELEESDWNLLFDLIRRIEKDYRYSDDKIRITVWYNW